MSERDSLAKLEKKLDELEDELHRQIRRIKKR